jgi:hypothetical protein
VFDHGASEFNRNGSFDDREHAVRRVSLFKYRLALPEGTNVRLVT